MTLNKIPAYGYESFTNPALGHERAISNQNFGPWKKKAILKRRILTENVGRVIGYIPLLCNLRAVCTLLGFISKNRRRDFSIHYIERSLIEATGLGIINLPIDIAITIVRKCKKNQAQQLGNPVPSQQ